MSEISDVIQILELNYRIVRGITKKIIDLYKNLYYGQWSGQASYRKFQKIAGSNTAYLEINTENEKALENVRKYLFDRFKLLYCQLPDFQPGDNRTQFILNSEQAESIKAGLNNYNYERLRLLRKAREEYGEGTKKYLEAKAAIEEEFPEIRSITADDYVMSALDDDGNKTRQYRDLEQSAREAMEEEEKKVKNSVKAQGKPNPGKEETLSEKTAKLSAAKKQVDYTELIKNGEAQVLKVADLKTEYVPIAGKKVPFYHLDIGNGESAVLTGNSLTGKNTAVLLNKKKYTVVQRATNQITKKTGKEIAAAVKALKNVKVITKGVKAVAKGATLTNPVTGAVTLAKDIIKLAVKLAVMKVQRIKRWQDAATTLDKHEGR